MSGHSDETRKNVLIGAAAAAAACALGYYLWTRNGCCDSGESAEKVFEAAFPGGRAQPIEKVRHFLSQRKRVNPVHLSFFLHVADQNSDGEISKDEFVRAWRVASYNNKYEGWADDLRLMAFRVMDTDHDGVVDAEELTAGLAKLLQLLGRKDLDVHEAVSKLLPERGDVLGDDEWARSEVAARIINRETVKPLLL